MGVIAAILALAGLFDLEAGLKRLDPGPQIDGPHDQDFIIIEGGVKKKIGPAGVDPAGLVLAIDR